MKTNRIPNCNSILLIVFLSFQLIACKKNETTPTLTTKDISNIQINSASSGGVISSDGGASITNRGICWSSTNLNPTINDNQTTDHVGYMTYNTTFTNLTPNTTYYLRAFAQNSAGTSYGDVKSFTTLNFITDIDGNVYKPITIGSQVWLAENLKVTRYNDGTNIPNEVDSINWAHLTTGAYCNYGNNASNSNIYGRLYNWYAVNTGKLCPNGWHVPTESEWETLYTFLGYQGNLEAANTADKLKEIGTAHWPYPNNYATNESGFTSLPSGERTSYYALNYEYSGIGMSTTFWTSSLKNNDATTIYLSSAYRYLIIAIQRLQNGYSVRCVKNK